MNESQEGKLTQLLHDWKKGKRGAEEAIMPRIERELRKLARHYMRRERSDHILQTTALINEAYLRMTDPKSVTWEDRAHFFGIASQTMRRILVEYARRRNSLKRGGGTVRIALDESCELPATGSMNFDDMLAIHEALNNLEKIDVQLSKIVELRHFSGLGNKEIAAVTGRSISTVKRKLKFAEAWLYREFTGKELK
ncbi:sigma-70 family RNA polymerase sigma factor [Acidobacteriota bacterium]